MDWKTIQAELLKPFGPAQVSWKPQVTTKGKQKEPIVRNGVRVAGCVAHIDARDVMNRLDEVVGSGEWSDSYRLLDAKHVECTLTIQGVSKSDVGETNEGGFADPIKSAYSDAFKRAAVKFGIGRHLYDMEMEWLPFDGYKITQLPQTQATRQQPKPENGDGPKPPMPTDAMKKKFHALGTAIYGDGWDDKRPELTRAISSKRADGSGPVDSSNDLYRAEMQSLIDGMEARQKEQDAA